MIQRPRSPWPNPIGTRNKDAIVTLGEAGALILTDSGMQTVAGATVQVVDTTGAGDAFNAGLAMSLAEGRDLVTAVQIANCAGAIACTTLGVIPAWQPRPSVDSTATPMDRVRK